MPSFRPGGDLGRLLPNNGLIGMGQPRRPAEMSEEEAADRWGFGGFFRRTDLRPGWSDGTGQTLFSGPQDEAPFDTPEADPGDTGSLPGHIPPGWDRERDGVTPGSVMKGSGSRYQPEPGGLFDPGADPGDSGGSGPAPMPTPPMPERSEHVRLVRPLSGRLGALVYPGSGVPGNPAVFRVVPARRGGAVRVRPWEPRGFPEYEARSGMQHAFPTLLIRAPSLNSAHANLRTALVGPHARNHHFSPTTLRLEGYGYQRALTGEFSYTQKPGKGRYEGGTSNGGAWFLPPEVSIDDHATSFAPPGRTLSTSYVGMAPGVYLGFGYPVPSSGGMKTGYRAGVSAAGLLKFEHMSSGGVATTEVFGASNTGQFRVKEGGGTILTFSGTLADGEFLKRDGTTLVGDSNPSAAVLVLHREVADITVGNTTTETSIVNAGAGLSIPGGTLGTDRVVELTIEGTYVNNTGVNRNLTVRVYYGTTEAIEFTIANIATSANTRSFGIKVRLFGDGATNAQEVTMELLQSPAGAPATGVGGFGPGASGRVLGTAAEDSTGALDLDVTVEHSTNLATLTLTATKVYATKL